MVSWTELAKHNMAQFVSTTVHLVLFLTLLGVMWGRGLQDRSRQVAYKEAPGQVCLGGNQTDEKRRECYRTSSPDAWRDDVVVERFMLVDPIILLAFSEWMQFAFVFVMLFQNSRAVTQTLLALFLVVQVALSAALSFVGTDDAGANLGQFFFLNVAVFGYAFFCQYMVLYMLPPVQKSLDAPELGSKLTGVSVLDASGGHLIRLPLSLGAPYRYTRLGVGPEDKEPTAYAEDLRFDLIHWIRESVTMPLYLAALLLCVMPGAPCWATVGVFVSCFFTFSCKAAAVLLLVKSWRRHYPVYVFAVGLVVCVLGCILLGYASDTTKVLEYSANATIFAPIALVSVFLILAFTYLLAPEQEEWWKHLSAGVVAVVSFAVVNVVLLGVLMDVAINK